ncbi:OprD family outer membrane porin [Pseudomonas bohemica]|uniref:OprD family outer membrane porin n=1 Tax=Pseudomonas bohemica TaxID=2044872 RepID=UPI00389A4D3F
MARLPRGAGSRRHVFLPVRLPPGHARSRRRAACPPRIASGWRREPHRHQPHALAALKLRLSNTELTWGEQFPLTPVFGFNDSRLLPGSATGVSLRST